MVGAWYQAYPTLTSTLHCASWVWPSVTWMPSPDLRQTAKTATAVSRAQGARKLKPMYCVAIRHHKAKMGWQSTCTKHVNEQHAANCMFRVSGSLKGKPKSANLAKVDTYNKFAWTTNLKPSNLSRTPTYLVWDLKLIPNSYLGLLTLTFTNMLMHVSMHWFKSSFLPHWISQYLMNSWPTPLLPAFAPLASISGPPDVLWENSSSRWKSLGKLTNIA